MAILLASFSALFYGVADYCGGRATRHATSAAVTVRGQLASVVLIAILLLADWEATPKSDTLAPWPARHRPQPAQAKAIAQ